MLVSLGPIMVMLWNFHSTIQVDLMMKDGNLVMASVIRCLVTKLVKL